ncbi:MAG TPA: hypothetical protein VLF60_00100 [Candidatus Saccharimonadales bacterium]|nr:hypothetical protein [Candidatus Saccharimonadales bacterium]
MLISHNRLSNIPILSLQTGAPLGMVTEPIIDPRQLNIAAFYCQGPRVKGTTVLHVDDIREVSSIGLIVDSADSLMAPDDLVRLKTIINLDFSLIGKKVVDTLKHNLGKVEGFSVDLDSFYIAKINVHQSIMKNFLGGNLLIDRRQIVEITDSRILVQAADIKERKGARLSPMIDNPFRHHHAPQPDGSQAKIAQE